MPIQAEIDAYGTYARASALADYAEMWAFRGVHVTESIIDDFIRDMGWTRRELELLTDGDEFDDVDGATSGGRVFGELEERQASLGAHYPFHVEQGTLHFGASVDAYLILHAIALAHSARLAPPGEVEEMFEELLCRILTARGLRVAQLGKLKYETGSFEAALRAARPFTGLSIPGIGDRSIRAVDEGVDAVAHLDWEDGRESNWSFIGQATCAKSDQWERKLSEPHTKRFESFLGTIVTPIPFLAVPHHISRRRLNHLCGGDGRMVLDRLRLTRWIGDLTTKEAALVATVSSADVGVPF